VQHVDRFKEQAASIEWHIPSQYSKEMACKSKVVGICHLVSIIYNVFM